MFHKDGGNLFVTQLYIFKCLKINCDRCDNAFVVTFFKTMYNKQLLDSVFVISGIIKVWVSVISLSLRLRLTALTSTLIIPDITKTSSNNCLLSASFSSTRCCFSSGNFWPITLIIIHWTHYLFSDWPKAYSEFSKSAPDYTIIMSRTLKVTSNHVMYDRGAWFIRIIMSLCCLPWVKKQIHDFQVCFDDRGGHRKNSWRQGHTKHKKVDEVAKELFVDYVKEKNWANLRKRKSWHKLWKHTSYVEARKKEFVEYIIQQLLDSVFVISRMIKVSVRVISLSR